MAKTFSYDLVIIGGGAGGLVVAAGAAMFGGKAALIDKRPFLGGDCLNFGCVPSKALIRVARAAHEVRHAERFGLAGQEPAVDFSRAMGYVRSAVERLATHDDADRFRAMGVDVFLGQAPALRGPHEVALGDRSLRAKHLVVATGSRPAIPGLEEAGYFDNETLFYRMETLPQRLLVIGAGPIGLELGQSFQRLGSQVTVVDAGPRVLAKEDPEASRFVEGMEILLESSVSRVRRAGEKRLVTVKTANEERELRVDAFLKGKLDGVAGKALRWLATR